MPTRDKIMKGIATILRSVHKSSTPEGWALNIVEYLHSQGVMIVKSPPKGDLTGCVIVLVEPLLEVKE